MDSRTRSLTERRVAPERVAALVEMERGLGGRLGRRPVLYGLLIVAAVFVASVVVGTVLGQVIAGAAGAGEGVRRAAGLVGTDVIGVVGLAWVLSKLSWWRLVGFVGPSQWRSLGLLVPAVLLVVVALVGGLASLDTGDPELLALAVPQVSLTGLWEEGLIRGFLLSALLLAALRSGSGPVRAVLASAVIFGLLHLVSAVGGSLPGAVFQVVYATLIGICFGALMLRTNALWLLMILHALFNLGNELTGDNEAAPVLDIALLFGILLLAIYGVFLLRRVKDDSPAPSPG